ncbi:MAG: CPBP family intramembrane glutamic endopeptidase [Solirubrobacteraceae bacterium]
MSADDDRPDGSQGPVDPWQPIEVPPVEDPPLPRVPASASAPGAEPVVPDAAPMYQPLHGRGRTAAGGAVFVRPSELPDQSPTDPVERPWKWYVGPTAILIALIGVTFVSVFAVVIVTALSPSHPSTTQVTDDQEHWFGLGQDILWIGVALLTPFLFSMYLRAGQLGMRRPPVWWKAIVTFIVVVVVFYVMTGLYAWAFHLDDNSNSLLDTDSGFGNSVTRDIAFAILYTVAAPVAEELLFRGLLFRTIRDGLSKKWLRSSPWLAALISGVIFGGIHYSPAAANQNNFLPVLMALGFLLAMAYQFSGTIYVNILIHSLNNAVATGSNTHPTHDWVYWLIGIGPLIAIAVTFLLSRLVRVVFPGDPPNSARPPSAEPAIV